MCRVAAPRAVWPDGVAGDAAGLVAAKEKMVVHHGARSAWLSRVITRMEFQMHCTLMPSRRNYAGQPARLHSAPWGRCAAGRRPAAG